MTLPDVQSAADDRGIALDEVRVSGIRYPIAVYDVEHGKQETVARVSVSAALSADRKGSHLSRFIEVLESHGGEFSPDSMVGVLEALRHRLDSPTARIKLEFPYFLRRYAPVSGASALVDYDCAIRAELGPDRFEMRLTARVPVTSVCPCSKAISDYGAHNQRGYVTIEAAPALDSTHRPEIWFDDLIEVGEASGSSPIYPLLKREDEQHVTMAGYDRPVFVEDMVRHAAEVLRVDVRVVAFSVEAVIDESIHNHGAFARLSWPTNTDSGRSW